MHRKIKLLKTEGMECEWGVKKLVSNSTHKKKTQE